MDEFARVFEQAAQESLEKWNPNIDCTSLSYPQWSMLYTCSHGASSASLTVNWCLIFSGDGTLSRIHAHQRTSTGISQDAAKLWVLSLEQLVSTWCQPAMHPNPAGGSLQKLAGTGAKRYRQREREREDSVLFLVVARSCKSLPPSFPSSPWLSCSVAQSPSALPVPRFDTQILQSILAQEQVES